jgi:hypothetical protein
MSRRLVTSGPHFVTSGAILRRLIAGPGVRTTEESPAPAASVRAVPDRNGEPDAHVRFIAADRDHDMAKLDAVAGSEFVDDRIRLRE